MGRFANRRTFLLALTASVLAFTQAAIAADPIKIGMVAPITGPFAESGRYQTQGAKLAAYDAVNVLAGAIGEAKNLEPEKLRQAILAVKGFAGAEGTYTFDKNGDGLNGYNIVKNNNGTVVFEKHIDFDD